MRVSGWNVNNHLRVRVAKGNKKAVTTFKTSEMRCRPIFGLSPTTIPPIPTIQPYNNPFPAIAPTNPKTC
jgi:hypothetical protein